MKWVIAAFLLFPFALFGQTPFKGTDYMFYYQMNVGKGNGTLTTPSAWLEIGKDSTTKGLRVPRVVDTTSISAPVFGLVIYRITDNSLYFRDKFGWRKLTDATTINNYLLKSDSTTLYYPLNSNPKNYVITELDPSANAKTIRWIPGAGIRVSNSSPQPLSSNPSDSIVAKVDSAIWNANRLQSASISTTPPTSGQILQYNGSQYIPVTFGGGGGGAVTSVGLAMPPIFTVTNSPVITSGTLTAAFNNQFANLVLASPNGSSGQPTFRSLTNVDLPVSAVSPANYGNDTAYTNFSVNSKGIVTNGATIPLTLDRVLRGGNSSNRKLFLGDTTGSIQFGLNTDYANIRFFSTGDNDGSSNLVLVSGDNAGTSPFEGFIFLRDSTFSSLPGLRHYDTVLVLNAINAKFSSPINAPSPTYSAGGITAIGRNNTTGRFETFTPALTGPASVKGFNTNATGADTLYAYTIPVAYQTNNGDVIKMTYAGTFAVTGATAHTVGLAVGGTVVASLSNGTTSGGSWEIECTIIRVSNTVIRATTRIALDNTGVTTSLYLHTTSEVTGLNLSTNGLRTGLSIGSPNVNVTATMGDITYYPAAL